MEERKKMSLSDLKILTAALETLQAIREKYGNDLASELEMIFTEKLAEKEKKPATAKK